MPYVVVNLQALVLELRATQLQVPASLRSGTASVTRMWRETYRAPLPRRDPVNGYASGSGPAAAVGPVWQGFSGPCGGGQGNPCAEGIPRDCGQCLLEDHLPARVFGGPLESAGHARLLQATKISGEAQPPLPIAVSP